MKEDLRLKLVEWEGKNEITANNFTCIVKREYVIYEIDGSSDYNIYLTISGTVKHEKLNEKIFRTIIFTTYGQSQDSSYADIDIFDMFDNLLNEVYLKLYNDAITRYLQSENPDGFMPL